MALSVAFSLMFTSSEAISASGALLKPESVSSKISPAHDSPTESYGLSQTAKSSETSSDALTAPNVKIASRITSKSIIVFMIQQPYVNIIIYIFCKVFKI